VADLRQWIAWADRRIGALVTGEGLHAGVAQVVQGPMTVTWRVRLLQPTPAHVRKMLGLGPALKQALQVEGVRITDTAQGLLIEVPSPDARTPTALDLARATRGLAVAIGLDQFRRPATVDLRHHPTILFVGPTRSGKSEGMRSALYALAARNGPARLQFVILPQKSGSQKRESWEAFASAAACWDVVSDPTDSAQAMAWLARTMLLDRARRHVKEPAIVIVLDDLLNLLQETPQVADAVGAIASLGGGLGVFQIIGTQDAGSKHGTGGPWVEANVTARVIYRPATRTEGARASGATAEGLEQLSGRKGDA
jgi:DNA segregation ATPase FtsK/SpoIIIE-like protein